MLNFLTTKTLILNANIINLDNLGDMLFKVTLNLVVMFILIGLIFYPKYKERNYAFTNVAINISVFLMSFLLSGAQIQLGFAFGLFAVFSIIRYRTEQMPIRQMTYLFISIVIAVLNALSNSGISYVEILIANAIIVIIVYVLEINIIHQHDNVKTIKYERIELIKPQNYKALLEDLSSRTGYTIKKAEVLTINFLNDTSQIKIFYSEDDLYSETNKED